MACTLAHMQWYLLVRGFLMPMSCLLPGVGVATLPRVVYLGTLENIVPYLARVCVYPLL